MQINPLSLQDIQFWIMKILGCVIVQVLIVLCHNASMVQVNGYSAYIMHKKTLMTKGQVRFVRLKIIDFVCFEKTHKNTYFLFYY